MICRCIIQPDIWSTPANLAGKEACFHIYLLHALIVLHSDTCTGLELLPWVLMCDEVLAQHEKQSN